jgi:hypothetical protein
MTGTDALGNSAVIAAPSVLYEKLPLPAIVTTLAVGPSRLNLRSWWQLLSENAMSCRSASHTMVVIRFVAATPLAPSLQPAPTAMNTPTHTSVVREHLPISVRAATYSVSMPAPPTAMESTLAVRIAFRSKRCSSNTPVSRWMRLTDSVAAPRAV